MYCSRSRSDSMQPNQIVLWCLGDWRNMTPSQNMQIGHATIHLNDESQRRRQQSPPSMSERASLEALSTTRTNMFSTSPITVERHATPLHLEQCLLPYCVTPSGKVLLRMSCRKQPLILQLGASKLCVPKSWS